MVKRLRRAVPFVLILAGVASAATVPLNPKPVFKLVKSDPPRKGETARLFVFEGASGVRIHRAGPEHFKLTRIRDGEEVHLLVTYEPLSFDDSDTVSLDQSTVRRRMRRETERLKYNCLFNGVRLFLDTGRVDRLEPKRKAGYLDLYGRAKLEAGERYRITWACWPVGAAKAAEVSCEFTMPK